MAKKYNIDYDDTINTLVIFEADGVSVVPHMWMDRSGHKWR